MFFALLLSVLMLWLIRAYHQKYKRRKAGTGYLFPLQPSKDGKNY